MKTAVVLFLFALAVASFVFSTVAVIVARRQLSSYFAYLPLFGGAYLPPRARRWRNLSNLGDVVFVLSCVLGVLAFRFL